MLINLRKNRKRTIAFIISSVSFFALIIVSIFLLIFYTLSAVKVDYEPAEEIMGDYVKTFDTPGEASNIFVGKNYGYIDDGSRGL